MKWIIGFENRYEITEDGKVLFHKNGVITERKLVPDKNGYLTVNLKIGSKVFCKKVHREVAKAFIYPYNGEQVNHIDGDKTNNNINNLEWCTSKENKEHMWSFGLKKIGKLYKNNKTGFPCVVEKNNKFVGRIRYKGKEINTGTYTTKDEAFKSVVDKYLELGIEL